MRTSKPKPTPRAKLPPPSPFHCADCLHAKDHCFPSLVGNMTLCTCKYHKDGKYKQLLSEKACKHFSHK